MFIHKQKTIAMRQAYFTTRAKGQNFLGYVQRRQKKNIYIGNAPDLLCICSIAIFHENIYFRGRFWLGYLGRKLSARVRGSTCIHSCLQFIVCVSVLGLACIYPCLWYFICFHVLLPTCISWSLLHSLHHLYMYKIEQ